MTPPHEGRSDGRTEPSSTLAVYDRTPRFVVIAGVVYVLPLLFRDWLLSVVGIPSAVGADYLERFGTVHVVAGLALRVPALALLVATYVLFPRSRLRAVLKRESARELARTFAITIVSTFLLNLLGFWPFMWRWASDPTSRYLVALVESAHWGAILTWSLMAVFVMPLIEEVVFRFGVLQTIRDWTGSNVQAVTVTSVLFALGHLGYLPPDVPHVVNASWLFAASLLLGSITLRRGGRLGVSLTAHATRNALEVSILLILLGRLRSS